MWHVEFSKNGNNDSLVLRIIPFCLNIDSGIVVDLVLPLMKTKRNINLK
jgi:hypothetical protein